MSTLFPHTISVLKQVGERVNGRWAAAGTPQNITGSVQPLNGRDLQFLPEGRRDTGSVKVYSSTPLSISSEGSETPGDIVIWHGGKWEVYAELAHQNGLINHYKYLAGYIGEA